MAKCKDCIYHAPQAESESMCSNDNSSAFGMSTSDDDYCNEYAEKVGAWNLSEN